MKTITLWVPLPDRNISPNTRLHWSLKSRANKDARFLGLHAANKKVTYVYNYEAEDCCITPLMKGWDPKGVTTITFEWDNAIKPLDHAYRPRDIQNAIIALKATVDGIVDSGLIYDDRTPYLVWGGGSKIVKGTTPGITITLTQEDL